jgi:hypothetical protein
MNCNIVWTLGCMPHTPVTIYYMTFASLQGCTEVSIDTCNVLAKFSDYFQEVYPHRFEHPWPQVWVFINTAKDSPEKIVGAASAAHGKYESSVF